MNSKIVNVVNSKIVNVVNNKFDLNLHLHVQYFVMIIHREHPNSTGKKRGKPSGEYQPCSGWQHKHNLPETLLLANLKHKDMFCVMG